MRLVIQAAVDAEVAEFLGRDRYARVSTTVLGIATVALSFRSTPPPGQWCWSGPSFAARTTVRLAPAGRACQPHNAL